MRTLEHAKIDPILDEAFRTWREEAEAVGCMALVMPGLPPGGSDELVDPSRIGQGPMRVNVQGQDDWHNVYGVDARVWPAAAQSGIILLNQERIPGSKGNFVGWWDIDQETGKRLPSCDLLANNPEAFIGLAGMTYVLLAKPGLSAEPIKDPWPASWDGYPALRYRLSAPAPLLGVVEVCTQDLGGIRAFAGDTRSARNGQFEAVPPQDV